MPCRFTMRALSLLSLVFLVCACATYGDWVMQMETRIANDEPQAAQQILEQQAGKRGRDVVLLLLNRAMLLRMEGDYQGSTAAFEQAKTIIDELLAVSVTEQAGALAINETMGSYVGEPFERVYIHVFEALNYLESGEPDRARVEALQLDVLLGELDSDEDFQGSALALWLSGMIFETLGEPDDALIAYRKALQAYRGYPDSIDIGVPNALGRDLVRLSGRLGLDEERRYREQFGIDDESLPPGPDQGEIILLLLSGLAPVKQETGVTLPTGDGRLVRVSMPYYLSRRPWTTGATIRSGEEAERTELAEDLNAIAVYTLEQRKPAILARAVARAVVKDQATRAAGNENQVLGLFVNIAGLISERADTRSWTTLPNQIDVARLPLAGGEHVVEIELFNRQGGIDSRRQFRITLDPGERHFVAIHRVTPQDLYPSPLSARRTMQ